MSGFDASVREAFLMRVRRVDWSAHDQADPTTVEWAFERVLDAGNESSAHKAYNAVLDAVGNDHAGWLWDAAAPAAPLLAQVVREADGWPRWAASEILIELVAWAARTTATLTRTDPWLRWRLSSGPP